MSSDTNHWLKCKYCGIPQYRTMVGLGACCPECRKEISRKISIKRYYEVTKKQKDEYI